MNNSPQHISRSIHIMLEGNIGVGKSTFLRMLQRYAPEISIVFEPIEQWQHIHHGSNLLNLFYHDTIRWAYTFQNYAFLTRIKSFREHIRRHKDTKKFIFERSIYCDRYCFARNAYEVGLMSNLEWSLYTEWFDWLEKLIPKPHGFIYLQADPKVCYDRVVKRNRTEERSLSLEYLTMIHRKHEEWLVKKQASIQSALNMLPIIIIDCNNNFENNDTIRENLINQVRRFADELFNKKTLEQKDTTTYLVT